MGEHRIEGKVEQHHLDRLDEMTPELMERAAKLREQVEPKLLPVTTEYVKERLQLLARLIQEHRELDGEPRFGESEIGAEIRRVVKEQLSTVWGTRLDNIKSAIRMYERSVKAMRRDKAITDAMDELFGSEGEHSTEVEGADGFIVRRNRWYDSILRLLLCRLLRAHRWMHCSSYVQRVPDAQPGVGRTEWWRRQGWFQCHLCGEQVEG